MGIKTVPQRPYSLDLAPCDFCLFPKLKEKLRGCHYETIEEMKESVAKVIDMLTQEDFHGAFLKLLERWNKCIAAEGDYFEGDKSFMCVLSIKVPIRKMPGNLFNEPCIYIYIYMCVCVCLCMYGFSDNCLIFIVIFTTFQPICPPAFFRYLSNSGTFTELYWIHGVHQFWFH